jgi:hypothetical protein
MTKNKNTSEKIKISENHGLRTKNHDAPPPNIHPRISQNKFSQYHARVPEKSKLLILSQNLMEQSLKQQELAFLETRGIIVMLAAPRRKNLTRSAGVPPN